MNHNKTVLRPRSNRCILRAVTLCAAALLLAVGQWAQAGTPAAALQAYLKGGTTVAGDRLGSSVAVAGDTAVVGVPYESSGAGAAYVFVRNAGTWTQQGPKLTASNPEADDHFGVAVAIHGDTVVVSAPYEDSNATGVDTATTATGPQADNSSTDSGAVYVFTRTDTTWSQQAYLKAANTGAGDEFGSALSISGDTVAIGAFHEDGGEPGVNGFAEDDSAPDSGAAYVFVRSGNVWSQEAYLKASNPTGAVNDEVNFIYTYGDGFGTSVTVDGDTVVVGSPGESSADAGNQFDENASSSGAAYVFTRSVGATPPWSQQAYLKAGNIDAGDAFGTAVSVSGETLVIGASGESGNGVAGPADNSASGSGAAYVFVRSGTAWSQQGYLKPSNPTGGVEDFSVSPPIFTYGDGFGASVAVDGDTVVVGSQGESSNATGLNGTQADESAANAGAAYVFGRSGITWSQSDYLKAGNTGAGDEFGYAVAVSGGTVVVGARFEDSSTTGVNPTAAADENAADSGAAYVYTGFGPAVPVNGAPTDLALSASSIAENNAANAAVGTLSTTDPDTGNTFTYLKVTGAGDTDNGAFDISGDSLRLVGSANFETKSSYSVLVRSTDQGGLFFEKAFTVTITDVNEAPTLAAIGVVGTEDTTLTFTAANFTGAYSDPEQPAPASIQIKSLPASGTLKLSGAVVLLDQVILAADLGNLTYVPALNDNGAKTFTVSASDGVQSSADATVTMTLAAVNDAPSFSIPGQAVRLKTMINDQFGDASPALNPSGTGNGFVDRGQFPGSETGGALFLIAKDSVSTTVYTSDVANAVNPFQATPATVTYTFGAINHSGTTVSRRLWVGYRVSGHSRDHFMPEAVPGLYLSVLQVGDGYSKLGNLIAVSSSGVQSTLATWNWADPDQLSGLVVTLITSATTYELRFSGAAGGTPTFVTGAATGALTGMGAISGNFDVGIHHQSPGPTFAANPAAASLDSVVLLAPVLAPHDVPVAAGAPAQSVANFATAISPGPADEEGQAVSFILTGYATTLFSPQGEPKIDASGTLTYTPADGAGGTALITVVAQDSGPGVAPNVNISAPQTFTITVTSPVNTAPTLAAIGVSGTEDTTLMFTAANFTGAYSDPEQPALASIQIKTLPPAASGTLKLSGTDVLLDQVILAANLVNLTFEPALNINGVVTFTVSASDGVLSSADATVTMTLAAVNDAPSFALDDKFANPNLNGAVHSVVETGDGKLLVAGVFTTAGSGNTAYGNLARFNANGTVDTSFANPNLDQILNQFSYFHYANSVAVDGDGKILVGGTFTTAGSGNSPYGGLARFNADGSLDTSFANPNLRDNNGTAGNANSVVVAGDGKILVGGTFTTAGSGDSPYGGLARFNADGSLDTGFANPNLRDNGTAGNANSVVVDGNGKILVGGSFTAAGSENLPYAGLARFNVDGTLDKSFANPNLNDDALSVAVDGDGKILVGGSFRTAGSGNSAYGGIARFHTDGTLDTSFANPNLGGLPNPDLPGWAESVAVDKNSKILVGGFFKTAGSGNRAYSGIARFHSTGVLDTSFANPNLSGHPLANLAYSVTEARGGDVLVGGVFLTAGSGNRPYTYLTRLNANSIAGITVAADAGPQTMPNIATGFLPGGGADESGQTLAGYTVTVQDGGAGLFSAAPAIDINGTLTFTRRPNVGGIANVTVTATDSAGASSAPQTFQINVLGVACPIAELKNDSAAPQAASLRSRAFRLLAKSTSAISLAEAPSAISLATFYALEGLLGDSAEGRRLKDLYWAHGTEIVQLMRAQPALRDQMTTVMNSFQPLVVALLSARGQEVQITQGMIDQLNTLGDTMLTFASPELAQTLNTERARHNGLQDFVNRDFSQWAQILQVPVPVTPITVNNAPTDIVLSATSIAENNAANAPVGNLTATDVDPGETHTFSLVAGAGDTDNALFNISGNALRQTGSADFEAKSSYTVRVRATDNGVGNLTFDTALTITVTDVNDAPVLGAISVSGTEGTTLTFTAANFTGVYSDPENTALASIKIETLPVSGTLKLSGADVTLNQVITAPSLGNLTYVPALNENGTKTFTVSASDGALSSPVATVTMTLAAVNDTPSFSIPGQAPRLKMVINDPFGDADPGVNSSGTGNGFVDRGQFPGSETGGALVLNPNLSSTTVYTSALADAVNPFQATPATVTYTFGAINHSGTVIRRLWVGYRRSGETSDHFWGTAVPGLYVSVLQGGEGYANLGNLIAVSSSGVSSTLATWNWADPNQLSGLVVTLITSASTYELQFSGAVGGTPTFLTGAATGALTGMGTISGNFDVGIMNQRPDSGDVPAAASLDSVVLLAPVLAPYDVPVTAGAPAQRVANFATAISPGPADEAGQTVSFILTGYATTLFSPQGEPKIDASGTLTYTPADGAGGTALITVVAQDSGPGGAPDVNISAPQTFTITVTPQIVVNTATELAAAIAAAGPSGTAIVLSANMDLSGLGPITKNVTFTAGGGVTLTGTLQVGSGGTVNLGGGTLTGASITVENGGTLPGAARSTEHCSSRRAAGCRRARARAPSRPTAAPGPAARATTGTLIMRPARRAPRICWRSTTR